MFKNKIFQIGISNKLLIDYYIIIVIYLFGVYNLSELIQTVFTHT